MAFAPCLGFSQVAFHAAAPISCVYLWLTQRRLSEKNILLKREIEGNLEEELETTEENEEIKFSIR